MLGSTGYMNCPEAETSVVNGRKIIGMNIPQSEPAWHIAQCHFRGSPTGQNVP